MAPFLPETAEKIAGYVNFPLRSLAETETFGLYPNGRIAESDEALFVRCDWKEIAPKIEAIREAQLKEYERENGGAEREESVPQITIDDFAKVQLQVGEIVACERVKKSDKLLHETVRVGNEERSVVSGIAKHYTPEEMIGKKVVLVTNLKPVRLCGVLSEGMVLCAEDENGALSLLTPEKDMPSGAKIR